MGMRNKLKGKFDTHKSNRTEKSDIKDINDQIQAEKDKIDENIMKLGNFYWTLYATDENNEFIPPKEAQEIFDAIEDSVRNIAVMEGDMEERKVLGEEERKKIDEDTAQREEEERVQKLMQQQEREAKKAAKQAEKEAEREARQLQREAEEAERVIAENKEDDLF